MGNILNHQVKAILTDSDIVSNIVTQFDNKTFIINKIKNFDHDKKLFHILFEFSKEEALFYAENSDYYIAFEYGEGMPVKDVFYDNLYSISFEKRLYLLSEILTKIHSKQHLPLPLLLSITKTENILILNDLSVDFQFSISEEFCKSSLDEKILFEHLSQLISLILKVELSIKDNMHLQIIYQKCLHGIYSSIPAIIYELNDIQIASSRNKFTYFVENTKKKIAKLPFKKILMVAVLIAFAITTFFNIYNQVPPNYTNVTKVGSLPYITELPLNDAPTLTTPIMEEIPEEADFAIPPNTEIEFQPYIINPKDTLLSICLGYYPDERFTETITSFNSLENEEGFIAGKIIKLPKATDVIDFLLN